MAIRRSVWIIALVVLCAAALAWLLQGTLANSQTDQQRLWAIAAQLHAPGDTTTQTVATSTVPAAWTMRAQIEHLLLKGESNQQVLTTIEQEYGPTALADPQTNGFGLLVWVLPIALLGLAAVVLLQSYRRLQRRLTLHTGHTVMEDQVLSDHDVEEDWKRYL